MSGPMVAVSAVAGLLLLVAGCLVTFLGPPPAASARESFADVRAVLGIVLMVTGVVLLLSRFLQ
jgi:uncharacterized membrane protein